MGATELLGWCGAALRHVHPRLPSCPRTHAASRAPVAAVASARISSKGSGGARTHVHVRCGRPFAACAYAWPWGSPLKAVKLTPIAKAPRAAATAAAAAAAAAAPVLDSCATRALAVALGILQDLRRC
eukprot:356427-Chlamydomonas_euryale.AAC.8